MFGIERLWRPARSAMHSIFIARHMIYHVMIGLVYAWVLRELWQELNLRYIILSVFGSLIMDADHVVYWFVYGRSDQYSKHVKDFIRHGKIRTLINFTGKNHKNNTQLWSHNVYVTGLLLLLSTFSFLKDFETGVVLFGSMALHLLFDIADDIFVLGALNPNWKRWGRKG